MKAQLTFDMDDPQDHELYTETYMAAPENRSIIEDIRESLRTGYKYGKSKEDVLREIFDRLGYDPDIYASWLTYDDQAGG